MSLATRCPACNTVFRVVQDQLRVSEGWVRCGRCSEVFNAVDQMVSSDSSATATELGQTTQPSVNIVVDSPTDEVRTTTDISPAPELPGPNVANAGIEAAAPTEQPPSPEGVQDDEPPSFLRVAQRAERWQQPAVRRSLAAGVAALAFVLSTQLFVEYRDLFTARWPATRTTAERLCSALGCRVELPRMVDALVVESSGLLRVEGTQTYRLNLVLRNRSVLELAMPLVELHLSDSQGRTIARRAIAASELGVTQGRLLANTELSMQGTLAVVDKPVAGYTIDIFYP